jgi:hypothetical protein
LLFANSRSTANVTAKEVQMRLVLLIIVIILLLGALPTWPYSAGWGYYPSGGLGAILIIVLILIVLGVL